MKKVFVTGGAGFLASLECEQLVNAGQPTADGMDPPHFRTGI